VLCDAALPNVPVPLVDHVPDGELVDEAEMGTGPDVEHVEYGPPALLVGACWIESVVLDATGFAHGATGFAVHVSVRLPAATSAALGE
jgi:hypothetical protein